jgi:pilus assembly protein CpaC
MIARTLLAATVAIAALTSGFAAGAAQSANSLDARTGATMTLAINKSQTLRVPRPFARIAIGNADIADVQPVSTTVAYLLGRKIGNTNLTLFDRQGQVIAVVDVVVGPDAMGLKQKLSELLPTENIGVQVANDTVILSGTVSSAVAAQRAVTIAETYAPKKILNSMGLATAQQILLEVRFAEMQRGTVKALGINQVNYGFRALSPGSATSGGVVDYPDTGQIRAPQFTANISFPGLGFQIQALERQGLIRTLAQPNIIALSGETANFLAGGEFPVPTGTAVGGQITIEFKQFGVGLSFTPTLLEDGMINLLVSPEVSSLDPEAGIQISGIRIPGLRVRRARTTLELRDGQTFALAGLIQSDFRDTVNQVPLLGKIPIIGALFRSQSFERQETELVILVTPRIVRPLPAGMSLQLPTDRVQQPSDSEFFLLGKSEHNNAPTATGPLPGPASAINKPGGVAADHGHIVR